MRKASSTNTLNEEKIKKTCGMAYTLILIGGRWKPTILWRLLEGKMRYNELRKSIPDASERILVLQLRELEKDGLINRMVFPEFPPRVEYELTPLGFSMQSMLESISEWGDRYREQVEKAAEQSAGFTATQCEVSAKSR
jgi:DNA-binding HxlR family transcriptional regulator